MSETLDKLPPHSEEAEQGVLGCILLDPQETLDIAVERLKYGSAAFYDLRHKVIFDTLLALSAKRVPVDIISIREHMKTAGTLEDSGGIAYIAGLQDTVPSAANLGYYVDIVREKHVLRMILQQCTSSIEMVYNFEGSSDQLLGEVEAQILRIRDAGKEVGEASMTEMIKGTFDELQDRYSGKDNGIPTGFASFDRITGGLHPGEEVVVAARPSAGKTAWALCTAVNVAKENHAVGIFSLEMKRERLVERMIAAEARVNTSKPGMSRWTEQDFKRLTTAAAKLKTLPIHIDDRQLNCNQIAAKARRWVRKNRVKLIVIDYLQLVPPHRKGDRIEIVSEISVALKNISKELNISVIVLAQLNREIEKEKKRKPRMSDLRESGQIEQDADVIGFLHRVDDDPSCLTPEVGLVIAKNRNGPIGDASFRFHKEFTRFEDEHHIP